MGVRHYLKTMNFEAISKTVRAVGIKEWIVDDGIVDEATYKKKLREINGVKDGEATFASEPSVKWSTFKAKYDEIFAEFPKNKLRERRTELLVKSDWSQGNDVPDALKTKWKTYRQQLRDLPATAKPTLNADGSLNESSVTGPTEPS